MKKLLLTLLTIVSLQLQAQCWKKISGGGTHTIAIKDDGTLWAWGLNNSGQLGDGTLEAKNVPVQIGTDTDWVTISAGFKANAAIKANGTLWAWGINYDGQIAGGPVSQNIPAQIGTDNNWKTVECPGRHILAIKNNGTLWAWGYNAYGQLGLNTTETTNIPTQVDTATDWKEISGGAYFTLALKQNGTLWACGDNDGALGINTQELFVTTFTQIGTDNDWKTMSAGYFHALGVKNDGSLWAWGDHTYGRLGDNSGTTYRYSPVNISTDNWINVYADFMSNYGIKSDGTLWKWGTEEFSENYEPINSLLAPTKVGQETNWEQIQVVKDNSVFITKTNNNIFVWGDNEYGELGLGDNNKHPNQTLFGTICDSTASLNENTLSTINVYPNPTSGIINLANANDLNIEKLTVIDVTGTILLEQKNNTSQIDVQQLPTGMYILEITSSKTKQHIKFIKE